MSGLQRMLYLLPIRLLVAGMVLASSPAEGEAVATKANMVPTGMRFDQDVAYGTQSEAQKLDILYPSTLGAPRPAVFYVHGGGWNGGDKGDDPEMMMDMIKGFAQDGFVAASINYRLDHEASFPAAVEDCKLVVRWLRAHAATYGIDTARIGVVGGSAGGHLAAMLAVTSHDDGLDGAGGYATESAAVQAAASVSGPTDLSVNLRASNPKESARMVSDFLGKAPEQDKNLALRASPIHYVKKNTPPTLYVHCKDDPAIDADQSIRMAEALKKAGAPAQLLMLEGKNHGSDMARTEPVLTELRKFFRATLTPDVKISSPQDKK